MTAPNNTGPCESCSGHGLILAMNDTHGLRIERCDDCFGFATDDAAVEAVFAAYVDRAGLTDTNRLQSYCAEANGDLNDWQVMEIDALLTKPKL
jgi:hypothetical protein